MQKQDDDRLKDNMIFVGTIYDSFEALEETLGKLKLEQPLFLTYLAKISFAEEVFKRAESEKLSCRYIPKKENLSHAKNDITYH